MQYNCVCLLIARNMIQINILYRIQNDFTRLDLKSVLKNWQLKLIYLLYFLDRKTIFLLEIHMPYT